MQELALKFQVSNEEDNESEMRVNDSEPMIQFHDSIDSRLIDIVGSHNFSIMDGVNNSSSRSDSMEPPWPEMVSVMILLANFTVYSIGSNSTLAAAAHPPTPTVSFSFETTELSKTQEPNQNKGKSIVRSKSHPTIRTMVSQLVKHERIETTVAKVKEVRRFVDNMIQLGKDEYCQGQLWRFGVTAEAHSGR